MSSKRVSFSENLVTEIPLRACSQSALAGLDSVSNPKRVSFAVDLVSVIPSVDTRSKNLEGSSIKIDGKKEGARVSFAERLVTMIPENPCTRTRVKHLLTDGKVLSQKKSFSLHEVGVDPLIDLSNFENPRSVIAMDDVEEVKTQIVGFPNPSLNVEGSPNPNPNATGLIGGLQISNDERMADSVNLGDVLGPVSGNLIYTNDVDSEDDEVISGLVADLVRRIVVEGILLSQCGGDLLAVASNDANSRMVGGCSVCIRTEFWLMSRMRCFEKYGAMAKERVSDSFEYRYEVPAACVSNGYNFIVSNGFDRERAGSVPTLMIDGLLLGSM